MKIPDLNLLTYAVDLDSPDHQRALRWWSDTLSGGETLGLTWTVPSGFVRLKTNARVDRSPLALDAPLDRVERHAHVLRDMLGRTGTAGSLVSDAQKAALAVEHGATLCSADRDFGRFVGLDWVNPLAL